METIIQLFSYLVELVVSPEILFAIGGFGFNLLVIPTLLDHNAAIPRIQSVLSAVVLLFFFAIPYYWIGFYWSSFANIIGVILWSVVAVFRSPPQIDNSQISSSTSSNVQPAD